MSGLYVPYPASGSGSGVTIYANFAAFPASATDGTLGVDAATNTLYMYDSTGGLWLPVGGTSVPLTVGSLDGAAKSAAGATIGSNSVYMQTANASFPGLVSTTGSQSLAGTKIFTSQVFVGPADPTIVSNANPPLIATSAAGNSTVALLAGPVGTAQGALAFITVNNGTFYIQGVASNEGTGGSASPILLNPQGAQVTIGSAHKTITFTGYATGPLRADADIVSVGSVSLTSEVSGTLNIVTQTNGSVSLVNQVSGSLSGTTQINGIIPRGVGGTGVSATTANNLFNNISPMTALGDLIFGSAGGLAARLAGATTNSVSYLTVTGSGGSSATPVWRAGIPVSQFIGSVSLTTQVTGNLPLSQTSGSISLTNQVVGILPQANIPTTLAIGSITMTSSTGGAAYSINWPGAQGTLNQTLLNSGAGNLAWGSVLTNPMTTSGDIIVGSGSGVAARLAVGAENTVLKSTIGGAGDHSWGFPEGNVTVRAADYTVLTSDGIIVCGSGTANVVLPAATTAAGQKFKLINNTNSFDQIKIWSTSSQTLSLGSSTFTTLNTQGESIEFNVVSSQGYVIANRSIPKTEFNSLSFAPNAAGYGTVASTSYVCTRDGQYLDCRLRFSCGTPGAASATIVLPTQLTLDTTRLVSGLSNLVGTWAVFENASTNFYPNLAGIVTLRPANPSNVYVSLKGSNLTGEDTLVNGITGTTGAPFALLFRIPISGWKG